MPGEGRLLRQAKKSVELESSNAVLRRIRPQYRPKFTKTTFHDLIEANKLISRKSVQDTKISTHEFNDLSRSGFFHVRVGLRDARNKLVYRYGKPVTSWETPNRIMGSLLHLVDNGLKLDGSNGVSEFKSRNPTTNIGLRAQRRYLRILNNRRQPKHISYDFLDFWKKSPLAPSSNKQGLHVYGSFSKLYGNTKRIIRLSGQSRLRDITRYSKVFKDYYAHISVLPHKLSKTLSKKIGTLRQIPAGLYSNRVWVSGGYNNTKRFVHRNFLTNKNLLSPLTNVMPHTRIGYASIINKKNYMPPWWFNNVTIDAVDSGVAAIGGKNLIRIKTPNNNFDLRYIGARKAFKPAVIRPRFKWLGYNRSVLFYKHNLRSLIPVAKSWGYVCNPVGQPSAGYITTHGRFKNYFNINHSNTAKMINNSFSALSNLKNLNKGLGLYRTHPRWTSKLEKKNTLPFNKARRVVGNRVLLSNIDHQHCPNIKRPWLRNGVNLY